MLTVAPKPITWRVADTSFTYGGLKNCEPGGNCLAWAPLDGPPAYGQVLFDGVLAGDDITGAQALIDQIGRQGVISAGLPAGPYYQVVTGLGGGSSPNYVIASAGNTPGVLTVKPQWLSYTVSHGAYLPEIGVIGDPGKVTALLGWKPGSSGGVPVQADVQGVMVTRDLWDRIVRDPSQLGLGRYTLRVETLAGSDASNYRIVQPDDRFRDASSTAGVFQVFGNSSLGMNLASALAPPQPVAVPTSAGAPASSSSAPAPAVEAPTDTAFSARTGLGFDFGRYDNVSGTDGHVTISSAAGRAQAVTETSTEVGGVELSAQAGSAAEALATFGVRGVSARAEAGAHVDAQLASGPGFASVGAQANAEVELSANRSGVKAGAEAAVGASAQGGAAGDIGIGEGSADATASVFAYARSDNEWTFKDGRLTTKAEQKIGVGASAGTSVGFESGPGKVDAGIIVYSPGSLGGSFDFSGGYSDGTLSLSIDLGAQIGLLGAGISLDFSLDLDAIGDDLHSAARTVGEAFMSGIFGIDFSETPSQESIVWNAFKGALDVKDKDPVTRLRYLKENQDWREYKPGGVIELAMEKSRMDNLVRAYDYAMQRAQSLQQRQHDLQATFSGCSRPTLRRPPTSQSAASCRQSGTRSRCSSRTSRGWGWPWPCRTARSWRSTTSDGSTGGSRIRGRDTQMKTRMLKTRMALALVVLGTLAAGAALAQSPTPAGPIGISPTGQPRGYTLRFEPYQITGWGRARFGMSEAEVRAAIAQEFPDAGPVAQTTEPSQGTLVLTVVVPKAEPGPGPATISYVFGASSRTLAAVNVSWLAPGDATPAQRRALIAAGSELLAGLLGSYWAPLTTARGHVLAPGVVILFASRDPQGHGIEVRLDGVPLDLQRPSSNGVPRPLERMVAPPGSARLRLSVVADPLRPDVRRPPSG